MLAFGFIRGCIQGPVIVITANVQHETQSGLEVRGREFTQMRQNTRFAVPEIFLKPVTNIGNPKRATLKIDTARMVHIRDRILCKQPIDRRGRVGDRQQIGTTDGRTIHPIVKPRILPDRPQYSVFDVIEG